MGCDSSMAGLLHMHSAQLTSARQMSPQVPATLLLFLPLGPGTGLGALLLATCRPAAGSSGPFATHQPTAGTSRLFAACQPGAGTSWFLDTCQPVVGTSGLLAVCQPSVGTSQLLAAYWPSVGTLGHHKAAAQSSSFCHSGMRWQS